MSARTHSHASREARLEQVQNDLTSAVAALVTGEDWKRALVYAAKFRSRSFNNTLLICAAHAAAYEAGQVPSPTPTYVAGFHQWLSLGRHVTKDQHGYPILAPVTARFASFTPANAITWRRLARTEKPQRGETMQNRVIGFRPTHVWDVSQTAGDPLPEPPQPQLLTGQAPAGLWDGLADQITAAGYELRLVSSAVAIGGANGLTDFLSREVSVRVDMDDAAQAKTLAHELGHVLLHAPQPSQLDTGVTAEATLHRGTAEVEAESVALMVAAGHGLNTTAYTVPYVASWATTVPGKDPAEVVQDTGERVRAAALSILDHLDTVQTGDGKPPGLDQQLRRLHSSDVISATRLEPMGHRL
jgi:hypothetical protein